MESLFTFPESATNYYQKCNFLESLKAKFDELLRKEQTKIDKEYVEYVLNRPQVQQRSDGWYKKRSQMLTASSDIINIIRSSKGIENVIKKKCGESKPFKGNRYTQHGVKYEPISTDIYASRYRKQVKDVGLLKHESIPNLGASPDGITQDGRLVEIKSTATRSPDGKIKDVYFAQMQTQMQVCGAKVCDFFECYIREYTSKKDYDKDKFVRDNVLLLNIVPSTTDIDLIKVPNDRRTEYGLEKGMVGRIGRDSVGEDNKYEYPPMHMTSNQQYNWLLKKQQKYDEKGMTMTIDYWYVSKSSYQAVERDDKWWEDNDITNKIQHTWSKVRERRIKKDGKKSPKQKQALITQML